MAERTNSELFTKNSLKLQTGSFVIQSVIQDIPDTVIAKTASVSIQDDGKDVYRGSTTKTYQLPVVNVTIASSIPIGEWTTRISDNTVTYTISGDKQSTSYRCTAKVYLMEETILTLPYNIKAILNGVLIINDVEYVLTQPHQFNFKDTIIFEDSNGNKIEWSKKDHTTWVTKADADLRESSVFLTYLI